MTAQHAFKAILDADFFSLFNLPEKFDIDLSSLAERYRDLQKQTHPDRFSAGFERERLLATQLAAYANEAYQTLKSDLPRAKYLFSLKTDDWQDEQASVNDPALLMEQMELRDELDLIRSGEDPAGKLIAFSNKLEQRIQQIRQSYGDSLEKNQLNVAKKHLHEWQFVCKILQQADLLLEELEDI